MTVEVRPAPHGAETTSVEASLIEDWIGLAGYLVEAVAGGEETVAAARAELAAAASGVLDRQALDGAAVVAASRHGADSLVSSLLQWAADHAVRSTAAA
jgi:alkylhydroperoxidase family enzyme